MSWTLISTCVTRANPHHSLGMVLPPIHTERLPPVASEELGFTRQSAWELRP